MEETHSVVRKTQVAFTDDRGTITDIVQDVMVTDATIITTRAGAIRGNHYHKDTYQYLYMIEGRMRLTTRVAGGPIESTILVKGDVVLSGPNEHHAMRTIEDTTFLVLTRGPRGGSDYESDTFRLGPDELLERPD